MPPQPESKKAPGSDSSSRTLLVVVAVAVAVAAALVVGSLLLRGGDDDGAGGGETTASGTTLADGIPQEGTVLGDPSAKVTLLLYEDIQCPFCKQFSEELLPAVIDEYVRTGKVKIDLRGLDLLGTDGDSNQGLRAILAAARQGKAWQLTEKLYASQGEEHSGWLTDVLLEELAGSIDGLDVEKMNADAETDEIRSQVVGLRSEAAERGVGGTPWFLIQAGSGEPYEVRPQTYQIEAFRPILDDALSG